MADWYLWIKAVHVMAIVAWMAGLFYLPRLFVYHAETGAEGAQSATFKIMERRLYKAIMTPAMIAAWLTGLTLMAILRPVEVWIWVKLASVLALSAYQGLLAGHLKAFAHDRNRHSGRYFRIINEAPTLALIIIVIMVVVKPF
jgi:putative membrane protein